MVEAQLLDNPACEEAGFCQPFCGMCIDPDKRLINDSSLFGLCRLIGYCIDSCGGCKAIAATTSRSPYNKPRYTPFRARGREIGSTRVKRPKAPVHEEFCYNAKTLELVCKPTHRLCF